MTQEQNAPTREGLKVNALLERIAVLENEKADLRVDFTVVSMQNQELRVALEDALAKIPVEDTTDEVAQTEAAPSHRAD